MSTNLEGALTGFHGHLISRGSPEYDTARAVYNAMIDRSPAMVAQVRDEADVALAVTAARELGVTVAVRGGGHNGAGFGTVDDGLVIDLHDLSSVEVDPQNKRVRVGGGATWGMVDAATGAHGLATPSGIISTTGVGGLTLGGGLGHLTRMYGLAIDNLLEADVVLADGSRVTANAQDNRDLFWALRGAVATSGWSRRSRSSSTTSRRSPAARRSGWSG